MARTIMTVLTLLCLAACGGGGSSTPTQEPAPTPPPAENDPPPQPVSGIWTGTVASSDSSSATSGQAKTGSTFEENAVCLIDGSELVCWILESLAIVHPPPFGQPPGPGIIQEVGDLLSVRHGEIIVTVDVPTGDGFAYANTLNHSCCLLANNGITSAFTINGGLVQSGESIVLEMTLEEGPLLPGDIGGEVAQTITAPYDQASENARTLAELSRVYQETEIFGPFAGVAHDPCCGFTFEPPLDGMAGFVTQGLVVDPDGSFFLQYDVGTLSCVHSGVIESGDGVNTHRLAMTLESAGGDGCLGLEGAYSGLAYVDATDALVLAVFDDLSGRWVAMKANL